MNDKESIDFGSKQVDLKVSQSDKIEDYQEIVEKDSKYYLNTNTGLRAISNFVFKPRECIIINNNYRYILDIIYEGETLQKNVIIEGQNISSKTKLRQFLFDNARFCRWTGTIDQFIQIFDYLETEYDIKETIGKNAIGIHEIGGEWVFLTNAMAWSKNGKKKDIKYLNRSCPKNIRYQYNLKFDRNYLKSIADTLFIFNQPGVTASIIGWLGAMFVHWRLYKKYDLRFPILFIHGAAGSGKTETTKKIIKKFCGDNSPIKISAQVTKFTLMGYLSSSNTFPIIIDEFKDEKLKDSQKDMISNQIRGLYDKSTGTRGRADQTINEYDLTAPLVLLGEASLDEEPALVEREIDIFMSKQDSQPHIDSFLRISRLPLEKFGNDYLNWTMSLSDEEIYEKYTEADDRVAHNINMVALGLKLIGEYFQQYGIDLNIEHQISVMKEFQNKALRNSGRVENDVDRILSEVFIQYSRDDKLFSDSIAFKKERLEVYIWISGMYGALEESRRKRGKNSPISKREFRKQLRKQEYHKDHNRPVRIDGKPRKCDVLNFNKLCNLDIVETAFME